MNLPENETEYDYNLGQGRTTEQTDFSANVTAIIISLIIVGGLALIIYNAVTK